ncbi:MAG TPA: hypothetical protein VML75_28520 [Kofleriaceae bacterium]|nr:hypothetical protein [Kofleriaceae bacterium]
MTKFDQPEAWAALEAEDLRFWRCRSAAERAAAVMALSREFVAVQRQGAQLGEEAVDRVRRAEKLRVWVLLKERLRCRSVNLESSKTSSAER